jgi:PucR family transcriptional regulator, purine catabolism regulatory protein
MENVANDRAPSSLDLPSASGMTVSALMHTPSLAAARLVAGRGGLDRVVRRVDAMDVPDITRSARSHELLLTTGRTLRDAPDGLATLLVGLDDARVSALAVKLDGYLDELPSDALAEADARGLPVLLLPDRAVFDDILHGTSSAILGRQARLLERADAVHRRLVGIVLAEGDLPDVVRELSRILHAWVAVTTPDGRVVSQAGGDNGVAGPGSPVLEEAGRLRTAAYRPGLHRLNGASLLVVPIMAGRVDHGRLVAFSSRQRFTGEEARVLESAATVAALSISKSIAASAVESKYRADFVKDVLLGRAGKAAAVVARFVSLGWDVDRRVAVVVAELDRPEPTAEPSVDLAAREQFRLAWSTVVAGHDEQAPVVGFTHEVVAILGIGPTNDLHDEVRRVASAVRDRGDAGYRSFSIGVSRVVERPSELPLAYEQARRAAHAGRQLHGEGAVAHFDDLGVVRLLSLIDDTRELLRFARETLGPLADHNDPEMTDLRTTLRTLLDNNLNVAETSRMLHFHYNTLRYRITKLERMLGPFTTDSARRLDLSLALRVMEMRGV